MRNTSKLVLFDWGGVVDNACFTTKYNYRQLIIDAARYATNTSHVVSDEDIFRKIMDAGYPKLSAGYGSDYGFKAGLMSCLEKFESINNVSDASLAAERFINYTLGHYKYIPYYQDIVDLIYETANRCLIGLMSDHNLLESKRLESQIDVSRFDCEFRSYYCCATKSSGKLFDVVAGIDIKPENILLIDDCRENVEKALSYDWKGYKCGEDDYIGIANAINMFLSK